MSVEIGDAIKPRLQFTLGQPAACGSRTVVLRHRFEAACKSLRGAVDQRDRDAGIGKAHGNAAAHGAGADHGSALDVNRLCRGDVRHLGSLTLSEEDVPLRLRLIPGDEFQEFRALARERIGDRPGQCPSQCFDCGNGAF